MSDLDLIHIQKSAHDVLNLLYIKRPEDIDLDVLAYQLGATILYEPLENAEGMLVRRGRNALIHVDPRSGNVGRVRFAVAHEIGHLQLHATQSQAWLVEDEPSSFGDYHNSRQEIEANVFAAYLLMPPRMFGADVANAAFCVEGVSNLAERYRVSFIAAARRFVDESRDSLMVIMSEGGRIKWWHSAARLPGFYLRSGQTVPAESDASDCVQDKPGNTDLLPVEPTAWFPDIRCHRALEQSLKLGGFPWVLTLIEVELDDEEHYDD